MNKKKMVLIAIMLALALAAGIGGVFAVGAAPSSPALAPSATGSISGHVWDPGMTGAPIGGGVRVCRRAFVGRWLYGREW